MSETTDPNLPEERYVVGQEPPDRVSGSSGLNLEPRYEGIVVNPDVLTERAPAPPTWNLVQEINNSAHRLMREHRMEQHSDNFRAQFDLDIMYDSPANQMGIRTVRIVLRGRGNRASYSYSMDIREFETRTGSVDGILRNGVLLAIDRWRTTEQRRVEARLTGVSPEEWNARYEDEMERERIEFQSRVDGTWSDSGATASVSGSTYSFSLADGTQVRSSEDADPPWADREEARRRMREARRQRLLRREEARNDRETDPELVASVVGGLKPIF